MKKLILLGIALLMLMQIAYSAPDNISLVSYWNAEGNGEDVANNTNNFDNTGTQYIASGRHNQALNAIAGNAFTDTSFSFPDKNIFTLYFWVNCTSLPSSPNRALNWKDSPSTNEYVQMYSAFVYLYDFGGTPDVTQIDYNTSWGLNWTFVTIVKNSSVCWVYFNGTIVGKSTNCVNYGLDHTLFTVGGDTATTNKAACDFDEISIYSVAHSETEINQMYNSNAPRFYPFTVDTAPPVLSGYNCTSCSPPDGDSSEPYTTIDTTPTFKFDTDEAAYCAVNRVNQNYTTMGASRNCTSGEGTTSHICTLTTQDKFTNPGVNYLYIGCKDSIGNENTTSSSGALWMEITAPGESGSDEAIQLGIETSEIWSSNPIVYDSQQIYGRNLANNQFVGTFDKVVVLGTKRWALNYVSDGETAITSLFNITPVLYVIQMRNQTNESVTSEVSGFINSTYP